VCLLQGDEGECGREDHSGVGAWSSGRSGVARETREWTRKGGDVRTDELPTENTETDSEKWPANYANGREWAESRARSHMGREGREKFGGGGARFRALDVL
jgi:hypothetical protein